MTDALETAAHRFLKARAELLTVMGAERVSRVVLNDGYTVEWDVKIGVGGQMITYHQGSVANGKEAKEEVDPGSDQA